MVQCWSVLLALGRIVGRHEILGNSLWRIHTVAQRGVIGFARLVKRVFALILDSVMLSALTMALTFASRTLLAATLLVNRPAMTSVKACARGGGTIGKGPDSASVELGLASTENAPSSPCVSFDVAVRPSVGMALTREPGTVASSLMHYGPGVG